MIERYCIQWTRKLLPVVFVLIVFFNALTSYTSNQTMEGMGIFSAVIGFFQGFAVAVFCCCFFYALLSIRESLLEQNRLLSEQNKILKDSRVSTVETD